MELVMGLERDEQCVPSITLNHWQHTQDSDSGRGGERSSEKGSAGVLSSILWCISLSERSLESAPPVMVESFTPGPAHWKTGVSVTPLGREMEQV